MTAGPLDETWSAWTARVAADLAALAPDDWLTFSVLSSASPRPYAAERSSRRRRWSAGRRGDGDGSSAGPPPVPDVFVQARRIDGVLALECIGDTEFEGVTDLSREQQNALVELGWERDGEAPEFERTYAMGGGSGVGAAAEAAVAAELLRASLATVLGARSPADVETRRAARP